MKLISRNNFFALAAKALEGGKVLLFNVLIARYYGAEELGLFVFCWGVFSLLGTLFEFKLNNLITKEMALNFSQHGEIVGSSLLINVLFAFLGLITLLTIGGFQDSYEKQAVFWVLSLVYFFKLGYVFKYYFVARSSNYLNAVSEIFSSLVTIGAIFIALEASASFLDIVFLRAVDFFILSICLYFLFVYFPPKSKISFSYGTVKKLFLGSYPLVLSSFFIILFQRIDIFMIQYYLDEEFVGYYAAASNFMLIFSLPVIVVAEALAPTVFLKMNQVSRLEFFLKMFVVGVVMSFFMVFSVCLLMVPLFGQEFRISITAGIILSFTPLLVAFGVSSGQIIIYEGKQRFAVVKSVLACAINFCLNVVLVKEFGLVGAATSTVISFLFAYLILNYFIPPLRNLFFEQVAIFGKRRGS